MSTVLQRRVGRTLVTAAAIVACATTATAAVSAGDGGNPDGAPAASKQSSAPTGAMFIAPPAAGSELRFVGLNPCRILDTRLAGGVVTNTTRAFTAAGTLGPQGGNNAGCGVPHYAVALQVNVGAISQNSSGNVSAWAYGDPQPLASILNLIKATNATVPNMVTLPLKPGFGSQFNLHVVGSAHLSADVAGSWVKPLYVAVNADGSIISGIRSGVTAVYRTATGHYDVVFDRDITGCAPTASTKFWDTNRRPLARQRPRLRRRHGQGRHHQQLERLRQQRVLPHAHLLSVRDPMRQPRLAGPARRG